MRTAPAASSQHAQTLRALVLAAVASGGATLAHAVGGGHLVSTSGVLVATALLTGATLPFVRDHLTAARSAVLLAALQLAAHVVHGLSVMAAGSPVHGARPGGVPALPSHEAHGIRPLGRIETATGAHDAAASGLADLIPSPTMLLAHVGAAVAVGVLLTRGEQSWRTARALLDPLAAGATRVLHALTRRATAFGNAVVPNAASLLGRRPTTSIAGPVPVDVWHARTPVRRGPPSLLLT